jgi:ATP-binding cassette subfamily B protein
VVFVYNEVFTMKNTETLHWKDILRVYWRYTRPYLRSQVYLLIAYALGGIGNVVFARLIYKDIIDAASAGGPDAYGTLIHLLWLLIAIIVGYNICFRIGDYQTSTSQSKILRDLYDHVHRELQKRSYEFFTNTFAGSLIAKTRRFVAAFETLHDQFVYQLWMNGIQLVASVIVLWYESYVLGLVFFVWLMAYSVLAYFLVRWQLPKSLSNAAADTRTTAHYSDIISNILTVKMFGKRKDEIESFQETTAAQERARRAAWLQEGFWNSLFMAVAVGVFEILMMWSAIELWHRGLITAGTIVLVQVYVIFSFNVVWQISKNVVRMFGALSDANEMLEILTSPPEVVDPVDAEPVRMTEGHVVFENITHAYAGGAGHVFKEFTLDIPAGQKVALVGHSGAGKTTIVKLLLRFLDLEEGRIVIDDQDITKVAQDELRKHIAYVPQEPILFHRTLRENIAYARPDASRAEVMEAARRAHAHEFIERLPKQYDTLVGERGIKLSGGERQRVAIARALLKNAPIVVLDEATSSLDSISERHIQAAFDALMHGRTTMVIAHRLSTIQHMDRIVVLSDGVLAEDGTHQELLARSGIYAELWQSQVGGFIEE